jgi:hypothetical protein
MTVAHAVRPARGTPVRHRRPPSAPVRPRYPGGVLPARITAALNFALGLWLVVAPYVLRHSVGGGWNAYLNDVAVGSAVLCMAFVRFVDPVLLAHAGWLNLGLGAWLVAAPSVLGHGDAIAAATNDMAVGAAIACLAAAGTAAGLAGRRGRHRVPRRDRSRPRRP